MKRLMVISLATCMTVSSLMPAEKSTWQKAKEIPYAGYPLRAGEELASDSWGYFKDHYLAVLAAGVGIAWAHKKQLIEVFNSLTSSKSSTANTGGQK